MDEKVKQVTPHHHKILAGAIKKVYEKKAISHQEVRKGMKVIHS